MSTRSAEAESRENSPEDGEPTKRASKKRKVLSCYACRNRKMKCDRVYPVCGRCQKTGRADQCSYDPRLLQEAPTNSSAHVDDSGVSLALPDGTSNETHTAASSASTTTLLAKIRAQDRRIHMLERKLAASDGPDSSLLLPPSQYDDVSPKEPALQEEIMYRGKGFKSQFYGSTSTMSIMTYYGELQTFTRAAMMIDASLARIRTDFKSFRDRRKAMLKEKKRTLLGTNEEILSILPQKSVVDVQVALYFRTWETSYRILHEPTFWKEYNAFWEKVPEQESQAGFATMLILVVTITKCMTPKDENVFVGDSSADRDDAIYLLEICDAWLMRQSRKHLTLQFFQLQCLSLVAKRANCIKMKQDWSTAGDLLRIAIASGMHRNTSLFTSGKASEFEKEMKRRLWVTIMEFELQASIDCGLQSSLYGLYFDTTSPANLPDDAFSVETQQLPASRPADHFTSASYLSLTLKSLPLRVHLLHLLNNPSMGIEYPDVLHYDAQITSLLSSLPQWTDTRSSVPSALLKLQLYQFRLILHRPYARLAPTNQRYMYSFTASVDVGSKIVATYDDLTSKGIPAVNHLRNDVLRTGVTLSQIVRSNCISQEVQSSSNIPTNNATEAAGLDFTAQAGKQQGTSSLAMPQLPSQDFLANTLCSSAISILDRIRSIFEQKVLRIGTGYIEFWILTAAVAMLPSAPTDRVSLAATPSGGPPSDPRLRTRQVIEAFSSLCFRVLALQKDPQGVFASSLRNTIVDSTPSEARTPAMNGVVAVSTASGDPAVASYNPGMAGGINLGFEESKGLGGTFDSLEDMQVDLDGWAFPDFWKFDLGDDF